MATMTKSVDLQLAFPSLISSLRPCAKWCSAISLFPRKCGEIMKT